MSDSPCSIPETNILNHISINNLLKKESETSEGYFSLGDPSRASLGSQRIFNSFPDDFLNLGRKGRWYRRDGAHCPPAAQGPPHSPTGRLTPSLRPRGLGWKNVRMGRKTWTAMLPCLSPAGEEEMNGVSEQEQHGPRHVWADRVPTQESTCPTSVPTPRCWHGLGPMDQDTGCHFTGWVRRNHCCQACHGLQIREHSLTTFCPKQRPSERFREQVWPLCPY